MTQDTSGELLKYLTSQGMDFGSDKPQSKLAAYLANIKELDNVKGEGYGIKKNEAPNGTVAVGAL